MTRETMLNLFQTQWGPWLDLLVKSTILLAATALLVVTLRRRSAGARHGVWLAANAGLLVLPLLTFTLPAWQINLDASSPVPVKGGALVAFSMAPEPGRPAPGLTPEAGPRMAAGPMTLAAAGSTPPPPLVAGRWLNPATIWSVGLLLALTPLAGGCWALRRLRRQAHLASDASPLADMARALADEIGIKRPVQLLFSELPCMPMTWGIRRPVLLLPASAEGWPASRLRSVLLHELAHIKRLDCFAQVFLQVVRALYWFHPLVWMTHSYARFEQESACDDAVLNAGQDSQEYAAQLLTVTAGLPSGYLAPMVGLAMGKMRSLERRLRAILDADRDRQSPKRRVLGLSLAALVALLVLLSPVRVLLNHDDRAQAAELLVVDDDPGQKADPLGKTLEEVRAAIQSKAVKAPQEGVLLEGALKGMMESLGDPYSSYLPASDVQGLGLDGSPMVGIGVKLGSERDGFSIITPLADSPARKAGLGAGDLIVAIDGRPAEGMTMPDAVRLIRGPAGSPLKLSIKPKGGAVKEVTLVRAGVVVPSVEGFKHNADDSWNYLIDPGNKIGYIQIQQFTNSTPKEFQEAVHALDGQGVKGLVLDLRFCPGGMLASSVAVAEDLLNKGKIVTLKGKNGGAEKVYEAAGKDLLRGCPIVVLVNEQTSSAAEIVAGALKDNNRALIVGSRTHGKGSVQSIVNLPNQKGALKLTTAQMILPSGRTIQKTPGAKDWGVDPTDGYYIPLPAKDILALQRHLQQRDVLVNPAAGPAAAKESADVQLAGALKTLAAKLTKGEFEKVGRPLTDLAMETSERNQLEAEKTKLQEKMKELELQLEALGVKDQKKF